MAGMTDELLSDAAFDRALIAATFNLAAAKGWRRVSMIEAARNAALPLDRTRERFAGIPAVLCRFGQYADQAALGDVPLEGTVRDRLFDLIMRRIDFLQLHRAGVLALLHALPTDPATGLLLGCASRRSMAWLLDAAGVPTGGLAGHLRVSGLLAVWLWTIRAWEKDESQDLSVTMAALDTALARAEGPASWLDRSGRRMDQEPDEPFAPPPEPAG